ncbi:lysophospholipid acyltransferase family protein [Leucothrix arctica]|uniref:Lipid A biosynthesis acyltransferase n=1 Tax=Leucothrix arctica TaxID=1481894 RepID=A0A317CDU1_9GAMM|nr:lysophospholipid acyltransferase family protein [Leucothrix arctica]PWQ94292.1 lipid A biosynthesis acyltransferase [Leucothrix arctica]
MSESKRTDQSGLPFHKGLLHPRYLVTWVGLGIMALVSLLPASIRHKLGGAIGDYLFRNHKKRRSVVEANLKQVFPDITIDALAEKVQSHLQWYGRGLIDYSVFFFGRKKHFSKKVTIVGESLLQKAKQAKQPVVLLLAHSVMLEFAAVALSVGNYSCFGSYKTSKNPVVDWMIARSRCRFVDFVVSREQGLRPLIRGIQSGHIMVFLPDEDLGLDNSVFAPLFGREKATLTTPARLVKMGKAKAVVGFVAFDKKSGQYQLRLSELPESYPEADVTLNAATMNEALEQLILQSPEQYMWTMKWFKTVGPEEASFY